MPHIELGFSTSAFIIILLLVAAVAISYFIYRYTLPPVTPSKRILLTLLRAGALFLLLAFMFDPLLRLIFTSEERPVLAVLVDNSKSMRIADRISNRKEDLRSVFTSGILRELSGHAEVRYYTFGSQLQHASAAGIDTFPLNEDATDIAAALRALSNEKEQQNIHAALLLTDGAYNLGQNPVYEAEQLGVPLYTVGIGDSSEQK
ncbi:MAG: vWA domain-containing protein, partial [Bacteroidota bacterium]